MMKKAYFSKCDIIMSKQERFVFFAM